jgi:hypothetical protein
MADVGTPLTAGAGSLAGAGGAAGSSAAGGSGAARRGEDAPSSGPGLRRQYDAGLHLLDRQIVDRNGAPVANVDDLELVVRPDGRLAVSALLVGPGALGPRVGGRLGRWTVAIWRRLRPDVDPSPGRIEAALVSGTDSAVHLSVALADLDPTGLDGLERWLRRYVIDRIPGAGHADE